MLGQEEEAEKETGQEEFHLWSCLGDGAVVSGEVMADRMLL